MAVEVALGVTINPVAFLVISKDTIKLMPINHTSTLDKIIDYVPDILNKICCKDKDCKEELENDIDKNSKDNDVVQKTVKTEIFKQDDYLEDE